MATGLSILPPWFLVARLPRTAVGDTPRTAPENRARPLCGAFLAGVGVGGPARRRNKPKTLGPSGPRRTRHRSREDGALNGIQARRDSHPSAPDDALP